MMPASLLPRMLSPDLDAPGSEEAWHSELARLSTPAQQMSAPLREDEQRPLVVIGAGSIVRDAHGPAYQRMGLRRLAVYDPDHVAASRVQRMFGFEQCPASLTEAIELGAQHRAVYDLALPPHAIVDVLSKLPIGAATLIQKPLGKTLDEAARIVRIASERRLTAAVNFQLPVSPQIKAAFAALERGLIGTLVAARVDLDLKTEWSLWEFLLKEPRIEILLHSIHYLSMFGYYFGEPVRVASTQRGDPSHAVLQHRDVASSTRLEYAVAGGTFQVAIDCNHLSVRPRAEWRSELVLEGTAGRIVARIADNLDYPNGVDDALTITHARYGSHTVELVGNRFPMAFVATMTLLQRAVAEGRSPVNGLDLGLLAMRLAESCYDSNARGGSAVAVARPSTQ